MHSRILLMYTYVTYVMCVCQSRVITNPVLVDATSQSRQRFDPLNPPIQSKKLTHLGYGSLGTCLAVQGRWRHTHCLLIHKIGVSIRNALIAFGIR